MAIVLGTFTYSRWKACHIAYCYSKMLNRSNLFHWLPWSRMSKMCAIPQLFSDPFNPTRNKKVRVQPYCYFPPLLFLPPWFFLRFVCFSFASVIFELIGRRKTLPFGPPLSHSRMQWRQSMLSIWFVRKRSARCIKTQWKTVSSLGAEQVRFWKIKPWGILHS